MNTIYSLFSFVLLSIFLLHVPLPAQSSLITSTDRYEFYSNFWINLHHFLYKKGEEAKDKVFEMANSMSLNSNNHSESINLLFHFKTYA